MFRYKDVKIILDLDQEDILSIYLNVDPTLLENQSSPPAYRIWLKNALDTVEPQGDRQQRMALRQLIEQVNGRFIDFRARGKGIALFATESFWQEFDLPMPVANMVHYGRPDVAPLLRLLDEYERYGILLVDHRQTRLLTAYMGRPEFRDEVHLELDTSDWSHMDLMPVTSSGGQKTGGSDREAFQSRVDEHVREFWRETAGKIERWMDDANLQRLIVGGNEEAVAGLIGTFPPSVANCVVGTLPLPFYENDTETLQRAMPLAVEHERKYEAQLVDQLITAAQKSARGVLGLANVLETLQQSRAMTIVVSWPIEGQAWECQRCHYALDHEVAECPICSSPVQPRHLETLLPLLALHTGAVMELVHDEAAAALKEYGCVGAVLRY
ncbi:MAG: hypothetical protein HY326_08495 [Chloroflexi bacterium]|nr:hypothetical protein [Chloroflexota bacterium]